VIDAEAQKRAFDQILTLFVLPEIDRRRAEGVAIKPSDLFAAQVVFRAGEETIIRLNEEVSMRIKARWPGPRRSAIRAPVPLSEIEDVEQIESTANDTDAAHISIVKIKDGWVLAFDFRYNKKTIKNIAKAAVEFLNAAEDALARGNWRPVVANLFTAVELLAKTELLLLGTSLDESKKHEYWKGKYDLIFGKNYPMSNDRGLYSKLFELRNDARYDMRAFTISKDEAKRLTSCAQEMLDRVVRLTT
jgi:uncharacterized protein (UPF0332 family)